MDTAKEIFSGSVAGAVSIVVGNPLDVVKVRMQAETHKKFSISESFKQLIREDGPKGLFRGMTPPLIGSVVYTAVSFGSYNKCHDAVVSVFGEPETFYGGHRMSCYLAGSGAGFLSTFATVPFELIKVKLQVDHTQSTGFGKIAQETRNVWRAGGVAGLYSGWWSTVVRDTPATGLYFLAYYYIKEKLNQTTWCNAMGAELLAGGIAGVVSWGQAIPFDVIKTRLQAQGGLKNPEYKGFNDCARKILKHEGIGGFMKGSMPILIRAFPVNAITFYGYEVTLRMIT